MNNNLTLKAIDIYDELEEYECDWRQVLEMNNPQLFFPEYPTKDTDWDDVYRDMSGWNGGFVGSVYLKLGIKRMESFMGREIRKGKEKSKYKKEQMVYMIKYNPHIHSIIKTNLLSNLETIWK
jgi:hypothetical protein|tara:strand:- start:22125 stop:22493 length:369 start_codon:yes stop_codon:yes gene_type:complete